MGKTNFFIKHILLPIFIGLIVSSVSIYVLQVFAAPPDSKYTPGEILSPTCVPGSTNCSVIIPAFSGANSDITSLSGLTTALTASQGGTGQSAFTKGDLLVASAADALSKLTVGSNGKFLVASSTASYGVSWETLDLSNYIPYTGATTDVNLGSHNLITTGTLGAGTTTVTYFTSSGDVNIGTTGNALLRQYGYITDVSATKFIQFQVSDVTDNYELSRQSANILGFDIQLPLIVDGITGSGDWSTTGTLGAGAITGTSLNLTSALGASQQNSLNIGGTLTGTNLATINFYGNHVVVNDNTVNSDGDYYHSTYGTNSSVVFGGTNTTNDDLYMYGGSFSSSGDIGTSGTTKHYGINVSAAGTADNNYGVYISSSGATKNYGVYSVSGINYFVENIGVGVIAPSAVLHLKAGTAATSTAPLKFTSGTNLTTAEAGAMEYNGTQLYFTPSSTTRNILAQVSGSTAIPSTYIPYATTNGYLTSSSSLTYSGTTLTAGGFTTAGTIQTPILNLNDGVINNLNQITDSAGNHIDMGQMTGGLFIRAVGRTIIDPSGAYADDTTSALQVNGAGYFTGEVSINGDLKMNGLEIVDANAINNSGGVGYLNMSADPWDLNVGFSAASFTTTGTGTFGTVSSTNASFNNATTTGTFSAEQITSTDDMQASGKLRTIVDGSSTDNYISVGASDDLMFYHDGTNSYVDNIRVYYI